MWSARHGRSVVVSRQPASEADDPVAERNGPPGWLPVVVVVAILLADQLTKVWAVRDLADGPVHVWGDVVVFQLGRNTGGAFSLFQSFTPVLAVLAIVVAVFLARAATRSTDVWMVVGLSLVLGGALGNLLDRIFRDPGFLEGAVVDFISVGSWPTFNVADSAITVGAVLIIWRGWKA